MSPEQARGKAVDTRADIWSFGCVLFEMSSGQRAFPGKDVTDTLAAVVKLEPTRTFDVDVFVTLPSGPGSGLVSLSPVYAWAHARGIDMQGEHLMIHTVPVQLLPAYNSLVEEAVADAREHDYEGLPVRVVGLEHLVALALQAGGARRRERAWQLLQVGGVDRRRLRAILDRHGVEAEIPNDV